MIIEGQIRFPSLRGEIAPSAVFIRILDVSRADAPSKVLEEKRLTGVRLSVAVSRGGLPYRIEFDPPGSPGSMTLQVHVSLSGSTQIFTGDFITMESFPVSVSQPVQNIDARVKEVT